MFLESPPFYFFWVAHICSNKLLQTDSKSVPPKPKTSFKTFSKPVTDSLSHRPFQARALSLSPSQQIHQKVVDLQS